MKDRPPNFSAARFETINRRVIAATFGALFVSLCAPAGSFFSDFNSGTLPAGTAVYGSATNDTTGGYTNSGCIKLTTTAGGTGSLIIGDLDSGQPVDNFVVSFKALVGGGTGADGFSFSFANDLPAGAFGEDGAGSGLRVEFDTF